MRFDCSDPGARGRGLTQAAQALAGDGLVVLPTDTVYGLACDAFSRPGVRSLARAKGRSAPPAVLVAHLRVLDGLAMGVGAAGRALAEAFWPGALTLLCLAQPSLDWGLGDAGTVALRMPLHPVTLELLEETGPLAVTSAGPAGLPAAPDCDAAQEMFGEAVRVYLDAGPAGDPVPSTVLDVRGTTPRILRAGALTLERLREVVPEVAGPADSRVGRDDG